MRRAATFLRKGGLDVVFKREGRACTRFIHITSAADNTPARPSASSASSALKPKSNPANDLAAKPMQTAGGDADGRAKGNDRTVYATVCANPLKSKDADGADDADAKIGSFSGDGSTEWSDEI